MELFIEVLTGEQKGARVGIRDGTSVGRKACDILLSDSKVSSKHAVIRKTPDGKFILVDNKSSNGIVYNNRKVRELPLVVGAEFKIGRVLLKVTEEPKIHKSPQKQSNKISAAPTTDQIRKNSFQKILGEMSSMVPHSDRIRSQAFHPSLKLQVLEGQQSGLVWQVAYGPRQFGLNAREFTILDEKALDICFELHPSPKGVEFRTNFPDRVKYNSKATKSQLVKAGDKIKVGETLIQINFES